MMETKPEYVVKFTICGHMESFSRPTRPGHKPGRGRNARKVGGVCLYCCRMYHPRFFATVKEEPRHAGH